MGLESFAINPSINVSPYCYSIFRIEPYSSCGHRCIYCFGRWYRSGSEGSDGADFNVIRIFKKLLKFLRRRMLKTIPFRLSTLIDPFQPVEEKHQLSRHVMSLCLKYETPLIINTKSTLLLRDDLLRVLGDLASRGLIIVQISLSTINDRIAKVLEPNAPPPIKRLDAAERLSRENVPVIIRLQPLIPGITDFEVEDIIEQAHNAGVRQIIVESLRDEIENMRIYEELAYEKSAYTDLNKLWISYSPSVEVPSKIIRPGVNWRVKIYEEIRNLCRKHGLEFSTCKEGFYNYHTAENCCGLHYLENGKYLLRPTLHEAWMYHERYGRLPRFDELSTSLTDAYLFGDGLKQYPRPLKKKMMSHEKILRDVLDERREMIKVLLPLFPEFGR